MIRQMIGLAFKREQGEVMKVSIKALVELGAEELVDPFTMKNYQPGQGGAVNVKKEALAPFLEATAPAAKKAKPKAKPAPPAPTTEPAKAEE